MKLPPEYFRQAKQRALRFSGCLDAGTSGALAADVLRLLSVIDRQQLELERMRDTDETTAGSVPADWIIRGQAELKGCEPSQRLTGDGLISQHVERSEAERLLSEAMETTARRREKYAPPREHFARTIGAINAVFAHKLREPFTVGDWAQMMILDKLARHQGQPQRDNQLDAAGYAACWAEAEPQP